MSEAESISPSPRRGMNDSSDGSAAALGRRARPLPSASRRYSSSAEVRNASRCSGVVDWSRSSLTSAARRRPLSLLGPLDQRGELHELEVAGHPLRDVEIGVEPHLAEPPAELRDGVEQLVAHHPEGGVEPLRRAEQLLLVDLLLGAERRARLLEEARGRRAALAVPVLGPGEHQPPPRARHGHVQEPPHLGLVGAAVVRGQLLLEQRVGHRRAGAAARPGHPGRAEPEHEDVVELEALGGVHRHHLHRVRQPRRRRLLLAQPGLRHGGQVAGEVARRAPGSRRM